MAKLCPRGKAAAKRKFKVYPSAYANMYASAVCSGKVTPGGKKKRKKAMGGGMMDTRIGLKGGGMDMGSPKNRAIQNLKEFLKNRKKSKIPKNNLNRDRSPMEVNRVISKMKSDAQAMGGDFKTASELKPLKGESRKSFESRPSTKFFNKGGRVGLKSGSKGCKLAMKGKGRAYGKNS